MVKNVALISFSIQDNFQILPVEDNWEKGVRKEFKPFSSEIASQVSLVVSSFHLLWRPCVFAFLCVKFDANVGRVIKHFQESVEEVEKEDKKKVVVSGAATGEEDAFPKVLF